MRSDKHFLVFRSLWYGADAGPCPTRPHPTHRDAMRSTATTHAHKDMHSHARSPHDALRLAVSASGTVHWHNVRHTRSFFFSWLVCLV
jgi:hypothetical protein